MTPDNEKENAGPEKKLIEHGPVIFPKLKMAPNEPCWCGSSRKWKKCHKNREHQPRWNMFEQMAWQQEIFRAGNCSHPEAPGGCVGKAIRAHTIQKSGGLSAIAEGGHVMSARGDRNYLHKTGGRLTPQKTGINSASTFNGFCGPHDASLFRPIETGTVALTPETAFLSLFRSVAYEHFAKRAELATAEHVRGADAGMALSRQARLQNGIAAWQMGIGISLAEIGSVKADLDRRYFETDFAGVSAVSTTFEGVLPIAVSCAFHPEFDMRGKRLQSLEHFDLQHVTLSTTVRDGKSVVTFAWLGGFDTPAGRLATSYRALAAEDKATALALLAFIHTENWHARPSWWEGLKAQERSGVEALMRRGMPTEDGQRVGAEYRVENAPLRLDTIAVSDQILA